jgi:hypothetical protein
MYIFTIMYIFTKSIVTHTLSEKAWPSYQACQTIDVKVFYEFFIFLHRSTYMFIYMDDFFLKEVL